MPNVVKNSSVDCRTQLARASRKEYLMQGKLSITKKRTLRKRMGNISCNGHLFSSSVPSLLWEEQWQREDADGTKRKGGASVQGKY